MSYRDEYLAVIEAFAGRGGMGWIRANCPCCEERDGKADTRQCLGLNTATGGYNCQKCGLRGYVPEELRDEIPYMPAAEVVVVERPPVQLAEGFMPLYEEPHLSNFLLQPARDYLTRTGGEPKGRELPEAVLAEVRVGAILYGYLANRIVMPIPDYAHPLFWAAPWLGWVSRDYTGRAEKKYLYPKNMSREGLIYNEPALWVETDRPVFVVESILDTWALWPDSVAVLGQPINSQLEKLAKARRPVVVALDGDVWETAWMLSGKLRHLGARSGALRFAPRTDPGEVARGLLDDAAARSLTLFEPVRVG